MSDLPLFADLGNQIDKENAARIAADMEAGTDQEAEAMAAGRYAPPLPPPDPDAEAQAARDAEETTPEDLEAASEFFDKLVEAAKVEKARAIPTKERNRIFHVTRKDGVGMEWKSTVAARTAEEAIEIVKETDNEYGTHKDYTTQEGGRKHA